MQCPVSLAPQLRHVRVDSVPSMAWVKCTLCKRGCPHPVHFSSYPRARQWSEDFQVRQQTVLLQHTQACGAMQALVTCHPNVPTKTLRFSLTEKIQFCARRPIRDWFGKVSFLRKPVLNACPLSKAFGPSKDPIMRLLCDKRSVGKRCDNSKFIRKLVCMPSPSFTPFSKMSIKSHMMFLFSSIYLFIYSIHLLFIYIPKNIFK